MKSASTVRGFGWVVALGGLVACIVLLGHRPGNRPARPVAKAAHPLLPIDVSPDAQIGRPIAPASSTDPATDQAALPHRRRGNFVNNTPRRRELGWAGLLESPYDTPNPQQQDDATMAEDPDDVEAQARAALYFVGADADAEAVWAAAINDVDLDADTRQQLIEALDTSGLPADPQRLTQEHLALILNRIVIVEQLAPSALDEANAAAFAAVHGRLANLATAIERATTAAAAVAAPESAPEAAPGSAPDTSPDAAPQPTPAPNPEPIPAQPQPGVDPRELPS